MITHAGALPFTLEVNGAGYTLVDGGSTPPPTSSIEKVHASAVYTVNEDLTLTIPADDSIPTSTEGSQILSVTLAALSASSTVEVVFNAFALHTTTAGAVISALFVDSEVNARRTTAVTTQAAGYWTPLVLRYRFAPGDTNPHTYKIRIGAASGVIRLNGSQSARLFGGSAAAMLSVDEL